MAFDDSGRDQVALSVLAALCILVIGVIRDRMRPRPHTGTHVKH
ncbi:hypothetical protein ABZV67_37240 [Streptomyces sp. NPDC005065]